MAKKPQVHLRFTIGKSATGLSGVYRGVEDSQKMAQNLDDWVNAALANRIKRKEIINVQKYTRTLTSRLTKLYVEAVRVAVDEMMGINSPTPGSATVDINKMGGSTFSDPNSEVVAGNRKALEGPLGRKFFNGSILKKAFDTRPMRWKPLTSKTLGVKARYYSKQAGGRNEQIPRKARKHFIFTGELQRQLRSQAKQMVKRAGVVRVVGIDLRNKLGQFTSPMKIRGKKVPLAKLRVRLLPDVGHMLPGINAGNWALDSGQSDGDVSFERALGISGDNLKKLSGAGNRLHTKRPLLQPVFTYYTLFRAPAIIARAAEDIISQANLVKSRGKIND